MAEVEDDPGDPNRQEEDQWEERSLSLLRDSKIDQGPLFLSFFTSDPSLFSSNSSIRNWVSCSLLLVPLLGPFRALRGEEEEEAGVAGEEAQDEGDAAVDGDDGDHPRVLRRGFEGERHPYLSNYLLEEIVVFYMRMVPDNLDVRPIKRLANVLTLFQCVAANDETREKFVNCMPLFSLIYHISMGLGFAIIRAGAPNFLIPLILSDSEIEIFDYARSVALSVIGILCQGREPTILQWAIKSNIVEACHTIIQNGSELNQVIAMHILEAILQDSIGISYVCDPIHNSLLSGLMKTWDDLVTLLAADQETSPRLLFHVIRCYLILCTHDRGYKTVRKSLPDAITNGSFDKMTEEFPVIRALLHQLLLSVGREVEEPFSCEQVLLPPAEGKNIRLQTCARSALSSESTTPICLGSDRVIFLPSTPFG
uniref:Cell differentiation protein rcd1 n=1 Tax=Ananas comosus var. bracteatus TaxID=296719 RepID=A0A6V7PYG2_ANACO|nr:unnamed protein product [Ananas comosus var. bracteatus]